MADYASMYSAVKTMLCSDWLTLWWNLVHDALQHVLLIIQVQTYDAVHYYDISPFQNNVIIVHFR